MFKLLHLNVKMWCFKLIKKFIGQFICLFCADTTYGYYMIKNTLIITEYYCKTQCKPHPFYMRDNVKLSSM